MTSNGKVATEVAEETVQEVEQAMQVKLWLHPDALRPRDYIRGKIALKDVLAELKMSTCYDLLGTEYMYPWCMWALRSRNDPSFTWDQALDTDFYEFEVGGDGPPPTLPLEQSGSSEKSPTKSASKPPRPRPEPEPSSSPSSV